MARAGARAAAPHGAAVRKGDVLLKLETEKLDRAIADLAADLKISELAIHQGQDQLQAIEQTTPLDLEASQRAARVGRGRPEVLLRRGQAPSP